MDELMNSYPERLVFQLLKWVCPSRFFEMIEGDIIEQFEIDVEKVGEKKAKSNLLWNTMKFFRPGIVTRNRITLAWPKLNYFATASPSFNFGKANNLAGWLVFGIALLTYVLTLEPTASLWDCTEFIATSNKLEVPHPPGAPTFLLLGRFFSLFAMDNTKVAYAVNLMSALASAFAILFLYWSIVLFGRKLLGSPKFNVLADDKKWLLIISGMMGSLAYAFSDSFWFSAVEAEVYAMSSFSTAIVVWCILKWDLIEDTAKANRWLILIAYIIGLSIGVHLLNLLTLPAVGLIYYYKTFKPGKWGVVLTLAISGALILFINDLIVVGLPSLAGMFEIFFVNSLGLFFGSGAMVFFFLLVAMLSYSIHYTHRKGHSTANTFTLALTFILIGYGSYTTVLVRSNYDTPINEGAPKDVMSFVSYLKRDQYGSRPLLFGSYFTASPISGKYDGISYIKGKSKYEPGERKYTPLYRSEDQTILPRAWDPRSKDDYQSILGLKAGQRPTFSQNMYYMIKHQIGVMYGRYVMWNFAGRESDEQGAGWLVPSDWFKKLPDSMAANKARNNYFMIPFLMGLIGLCYQLAKDRRSFLILSLMFVMLGVAIVVYLNSPPSEPRERDYIYVGSYYAFAFWIGLSVLAVADYLSKVIRNKKILVVAAALAGVVSPALMAVQGWDDHDRSNRFFSVDAAANALQSCDQNGILFTGGDNDTFPLWYAQETEGCRNDVRVLVLSYCNTDWYINQTTQQINQSKPFTYTIGLNEYRQGGANDYLPYADFKIKSVDAKQFLDLLAKEHPSLREGDQNLVPSKVLTIDIDKKAVLDKGIIPAGMEHLVVSRMELKLLKNIIEKNDLMFLDLLVTTNWERPIYVNPTSLSQLNIDVRPYVVQEGNAYRILPVKNPRPDRDFLVNTEKTYDLMVNQFKYRGLADSSIYYTNDYAIQVANHRSNLNSLAEALIDEGEISKAGDVLLFSLKKMPDAAIPYDPTIADTVSLLFKAGKKQEAIKIAKVVANRANEVASFLISEGDRVTYELRKNIYLLQAMERNLFENGEDALARRYDDAYTTLMSSLQI